MKIGFEIDKYQIVDELGEGGMGIVFKAKNIDTNEIIAIKFCKEKDENSLRRFKREVRIQEKLIHKNIVPIIDKNLDIETPYFVMPLAIHNVSDISKTLCGDIEKTYDIFKEVCEGITSMHLSGNFHRDIKPSNVLIFEDGSVKVSDFGLAKMEVKDSSSHSSSNHFIGTIGYHAPEQIQAKNADHRTDVFQLGKTFYQMLTCDYPHLINSKLLPSALAYILQKATSPDPDDRYQSVSDFKQAIFTFLQALNPKLNPIQAIESHLFEIEKMEKSGFYDETIYLSFLDLLSTFDNDAGTFLTFFDKIPTQALKVFSNQLSERFLPFMRKYSDKIVEYFRDNHVNFSYAETVAEKMFNIFQNTNNTEIKGIAVLNTLRVSHWMNRFNAMDIFDQMLKNVTLDDDAHLIAQILNDEFDLYKYHAERVADNYLHQSIIDIKNRAIEKNQPDVIEIDWLKDILKNNYR